MRVNKMFNDLIDKYKADAKIALKQLNFKNKDEAEQMAILLSFISQIDEGIKLYTTQDPLNFLIYLYKVIDSDDPSSMFLGENE